jgi:hypothetical protein
MDILESELARHGPIVEVALERVNFGRAEALDVDVAASPSSAQPSRPR